MKKIALVLIGVFLTVSAYAAGDLHLFDISNKDGALTTQTLQKAFEKNGFKIALNNDMTKPFEKQFEKSDFKIFTLMTVYQPELANKLIKVEAKSGVFVPMGVGIYQANGENTLHVSLLTSEAQAKIIGIQNNDILKKIETLALKSVREALPNAKEYLSEDSLKENRNLLSMFEYTLSGNDAEKAKGDIKMNLEGNFAPHGFIMPSTMDFDADVFDGNDNANPFSFYETYSICKLPVIYTVAKSRPEAAAFAHCTLVVYKKKSEDKIILGFPAVYNWLSSAKVEDQEAKATLLKAQEDFESILKEITE